MLCGVTNCFLIGFEVFSTGGNTCLVPHDPQLGVYRAQGVTPTRGSNCPVNYLIYLYRQISATLRLYHRSFLQGQWLMLKLTTGQSAGNKCAQPQMVISVTLKTWTIMEECGKIVRSRDQGGVSHAEETLLDTTEPLQS